MTTQQKILARMDGVYSVGCVFNNPETHPKQQVYTYLTRELIPVGSRALVHVRGEFKVVWVVTFDSPAKMDPKVSYNYAWIVQRVDLTEWRRELIEEREAIMSYEAAEATNPNQ